MSHKSVQLDEDVLENAYYRMLDAAPDALVIADGEGTIRLVNAQAEALFGYQRKELLGAPIEVLLPQHLRAAHVGHRDRFGAAPKVRAMGSGLDLYGRKKDGTEFPLEVSLSPLETEAGLFILSALRDVTERRRAELAKGLLAAIVDSSEDAILSSDLNGVITSWNRGAERVFGYLASEAIGSPITILAPRGAALEEQTLEHDRLRRGETLEPYESIRTRKDGTDIHVSIRVSPIRDARGKLLGASCTARDISVQRIAEQQARLVSERLRSAVESIQGMFVLYDADDRIVLCNSTFRQFFGQAVAGSIVGQSFTDLVDGSLRSGLFDLGGRDQASFRAEWVAHHQRPNHTFELRSSDGRTLRVDERTTAEGGIVKTIWDVSDVVRGADELRRAHLIAESASAAKSEFLASMSHELRTPLNAILGFAQLLQRDKKTPLTERQHSKVDHILKGGEHLLRLIDDVLDLARIEAGRVTISLEPVDVGQVLQEVRATLEPMASRPEVELTLDDSASPYARVVADRVRFAQVLMNFGSNAIKYGKKRGRVRFVVSRPQAGTLRINVVDDGHGIPPERQGKLFEPFQRAGQELGPIEGTGIGLMICKRLANSMGGQVGFKSEAGIGSEFWIDLPEPDRAELSLPKATREDRGPSVLENAHRLVVYIEDNPSNIAFMQEVIEEFSHVQLVTAPTAEIGIEIVRTRRPDLVLMDINLPGMNGIEATQKLREWPETRDIPVVALTAAAIMGESQRKEIAVFDRYLTKPLKVDELTATFEQLFEQKRLPPRTP
jgi:PAS domain S-box-containing protein